MPTVSDIVRKIKKETNCYLLREGGNHEIWMNPDTGKAFSIPRHSSQELKKKTEISILRDAGLK